MKRLPTILGASIVMATVAWACGGEAADEFPAPATDTTGAPGDTTPEVPADIRAQIAAHADVIRVQSPSPNQAIKSPVTVTGQARGSWYFEGSFPVILVDWDGRIIAEAVATADGEWMTEEFVPFRATLEFETPEYGERGTLILRKDNPSGRPELDDALEVPVRFAAG
jgi:hypothetical protein